VGGCGPQKLRIHVLVCWVGYELVSVLSRSWGTTLGGGANIHEALRGVPGSKAVVLLCHEPDFADKVARFGVGLQLSGHSHGGQVRLPLVGPLYLPPLARKYPWGLRRIGPMLLYTNCGIGTIRIPVRWNCPPEITVFTLRSPAVSYSS